METYVALLRGVNVGGKTLKMEPLRGVFEQGGFSRVAAAARAKAGFFGGFGPGEKEDLLALWLARGTRWIAVYSCGAYGIDEGSI